MLRNHRNMPPDKARVTLRTVAEKVGLAPCSVSAVLNESPASLAIPQRTKDRVWRAAGQLNYRPNLAARSLRTRRTYTVALLASDIGSALVARIMSGVEQFLRSEGYCLLLGTCDRAPDWSQAQSARLLQRGVEGLIAIDAPPLQALALPMVFIDLPAPNSPLPASSITHQRLTAMGDAAAKSLLAQIEQKTSSLIRIALAPESVDGHWHLETMAGLERTAVSGSVR